MCCTHTPGSDSANIINVIITTFLYSNMQDILWGLFLLEMYYWCDPTIKLHFSSAKYKRERGGLVAV